MSHKRSIKRIQVRSKISLINFFAPNSARAPGPICQDLVHVAMKAGIRQLNLPTELSFQAWPARTETNQAYHVTAQSSQGKLFLPPFFLFKHMPQILWYTVTNTSKKVIIFLFKVRRVVWPKIALRQYLAIQSTTPCMIIFKCCALFCLVGTGSTDLAQHLQHILSHWVHTSPCSRLNPVQIPCFCVFFGYRKNTLTGTGSMC